jgi:hypothetical protein
MYGGITFNFELKAPAAWELACWGEPGLDQLVAATLKNMTSKNVSLCLQILGPLASGQKIGDMGIAFCGEARIARLERLRQASPSLRIYARQKLIEFFLSVDDEDDLLEAVGTGFSRMAMYASGTEAAKEIFAAVSARWLAISKPILDRYETLIADRPDDEPAFQEFFTRNPQILDPMAADIWPNPICTARGGLIS